MQQTNVSCVHGTVYTFCICPLCNVNIELPVGSGWGVGWDGVVEYCQSEEIYMCHDCYIRTHDGNDECNEIHHQRLHQEEQ